MTYKDKFVVEIKQNGKILRVRDDIVQLPFGSEYSLFFKNLSTRSASVKVSIDGQDVLDNKSLIIGPNEISELEGFLKGNEARNKFKFIQKTKQIQDHRGDRIDDGIVRVEFAFEKPEIEVLKRTIITEHHHHHYNDWWYYNRPFHWNYNEWFSGNSSDNYNSRGIIGSGTYSSSTPPSIENNQPQDVNVNCFYTNNESFKPLQDEGITVKGAECNQQFNYTTIGELEKSEVIIIRLKGFTSNGSLVNQPLTVKTKLVCPTCGYKANSLSKYCSNCGTFLE